MTGPATTLICPKCGAAMRSYERNGVTIDQCTECRGIFLDRGELERLIDAENSHYGGPAEGRQDQGGRVVPVERRPSDDWRSRADEDDSTEQGHGTGQRKRRRGFLGDLLDFD